MMTKKNMVKTMFMNILTAGIFATVFTACSDELNQMVEHDILDGSDIQASQLKNLEQFSYDVPVKVNAQGDWKIELKFNDEDNQFCYVYPDHGHGPATVNLFMLDNWTSERNNGQMIIRDLTNNTAQTFPLEQKCNLDNPNFQLTRGEGDSSASGIQQGDIIYGVGYGYNVTKKPGLEAIASNQIIALGKLRQDGERDRTGYGPKVTGCSASTNVSTFVGSSISEVTKKMEITSKLKGSKGGFSAEAGGTFTDSQTSSNTSMFAYTSVDVTVRKAYLEGIDAESVFDYLTPNAEKAINGTGKRGTYASTPEGFKRLFEDYGTHLIIRTNLGGRMTLATTVASSVTKDESEVKAYANASYKNKLLDAEIKSSASFKKSNEENMKHVSTNTSATGGSFTAAIALKGEEKENDAATDAWLKSLEAYENLMVVGFGEENAIKMIPLYDLVDTTLPGGPERYQKMKEYMDSGLLGDNANDGTTTYTQGDVYKIDIPTHVIVDCFGGKTPDGTLITEFSCNGKAVAWVCKEYIPELSVQGMVAVLYPIEKSKPNFRAGRFLGNDSHKACDICWGEDGTCTFSEQADSKGMETTIFLRGQETFTNESIIRSTGGDIINTTGTPLYLMGPKCKANVTATMGLLVIPAWGGWEHDESWIGKLKYEENHRYDLMKIGTRVWTRENYTGNVPHGGDESERYGTQITDGRVYFTSGSVKNAPFPAGWHAGKSADYQNLKAVIIGDGADSKIGERLSGVSGFGLQWNGYYTFQSVDGNRGSWFTDKSNWFYFEYSQVKYGQHEMKYITPDGYQVTIGDNVFNVKSGNENVAMQVRLVMDL